MLKNTSSKKFSNSGSLLVRFHIENWIKFTKLDAFEMSNCITPSAEHWLCACAWEAIIYACDCVEYYSSAAFRMLNPPPNNANIDCWTKFSLTLAALQDNVLCTIFIWSNVTIACICNWHRFQKFIYLIVHTRIQLHGDGDSDDDDNMVKRQRRMCSTFLCWILHNNIVMFVFCLCVINNRIWSGIEHGITGSETNKHTHTIKI